LEVSFNDTVEIHALEKIRQVGHCEETQDFQRQCILETDLLPKWLKNFNIVYFLQ
jgi:hypothetical protein